MGSTSSGKDVMISIVQHQMNIYKYTVINLALKSEDEKVHFIMHKTISTEIDMIRSTKYMMCLKYM